MVSQVSAPLFNFTMHSGVSNAVPQACGANTLPAEPSFHPTPPTVSLKRVLDSEGHLSGDANLGVIHIQLIFKNPSSHPHHLNLNGEDFPNCSKEFSSIGQPSGYGEHLMALTPVALQFLLNFQHMCSCSPLFPGQLTLPRGPGAFQLLSGFMTVLRSVSFPCDEASFSIQTLSQKPEAGILFSLLRNSECIRSNS